MSRRWLVVGVLVAGCGADRAQAPVAQSEREEPQVLFLVGSEVFGIRLDGTMRRSFGTVGDNRLRAGWPRMLPDGRIAVFGAYAGQVYPFTTGRDRTFDRVGDSVWQGDGACGLMVRGAASMVYFRTELYTDGHLSSTALRASTDGATIEPFGVLWDAGLFGPSPDGADHLLAVHAPLRGDDEIWRIDVSGDQDQLDRPEVVARIAFPRVARSPARLADGRVAFVLTDLRDHNRYGELWVVERDGTTHATGIAGVDDIVVVGNLIVLEVIGSDGMADLFTTDLRFAPNNITATRGISEHLGWNGAARIESP